MSKRNIAYIKPKDPTFLAKLKAEIGYKEGPTIDSKRQKLQDDDDDINHNSVGESNQCPDRDDEQPQVVVLEPGDLTQEEADRELKRIAKEEAEAPADLKKRIIFKKKFNIEKLPEDSKEPSEEKNKKKKKKDLTFSSSKLSFCEQDEEYDYQ